MRNIINKILFCLVFISFNGFASSSRISCPQNTDQLNAQFISHWSKQPNFPWFSSWAHDNINNNRLVAGMRTIKNQLPQDLNPHLNFTHASFSEGRYRGEFKINCIYKIYNSELIDNDTNLFASAFMQARVCFAVNNSTIQCDV